MTDRPKAIAGRGMLPLLSLNLPVLLECKPLLILAAALGVFYLCNGAVLPLYGLALVANQHGDADAGNKKDLIPKMVIAQ